ncbi:MAG: DNRLRE domain-containing protein [Chloroflexi bacterium]|nr:DNRLRE domain-containing protein [Chloroflexota bacterium]
MTARKRLLKPALILTLVATLLLAACTGDTATPTSPPTSTSAPTATSPAPTATVPSTTGITLETTSRSTLGPLLIDASGNTLYLFTKDERDKSNCSGGCVDRWPLLLTADVPSAGEGVNPDLLGTTSREDGSIQATYNGWPLYYFADDERPGDTNGQDVGGVWFVVSPNGGPIQTSAAINASDDPELGTILTDASGRSLYLFTKDESQKTTCSGGCADKWPPLLTVDDPSAGEGVDVNLLDTISRGDSAKQVTYNGWPLYYFADDERPGDTNGQDVGGVWFAVSSTGAAIMEPSEDMTSSPTATSAPTAVAPKPTLCSEPSGSQSVCLSPSKDNTLYKDDSGSVSNGAGEHLFVGNNITEQSRRAVIAFDIAGSVPEGSKITGVSLVMNMSRTVTGEQTIDLHRLLADWSEGTSNAAANEGRGADSTTGDATWIHRMYDTDSWETPGGDFSASASAGIPVSGTGNYTWGSTPEMVADVQAWLDDPSSNFGWLLKGNEVDFQTAKRFDSKERISEATRPVLIIVWEPTSQMDVTPSPTATVPVSAPPTVEATIASFVLPDLTITVGTTVTWTNADGAPHTTTSGTNGQFDGLGWDSPTLSTNETFSHTFTEAGTFAYTCVIHPSTNGTVTVTAASGSSGEDY